MSGRAARPSSCGRAGGRAGCCRPSPSRRRRRRPSRRRGDPILACHRSRRRRPRPRPPPPPSRWRGLPAPSVAAALASSGQAPVRRVHTRTVKAALRGEGAYAILAYQYRTLLVLSTTGCGSASPANVELCLDLLGAGAPRLAELAGPACIMATCAICLWPAELRLEDISSSLPAGSIAHRTQLRRVCAVAAGDLERSAVHPRTGVGVSVLCCRCVCSTWAGSLLSCCSVRCAQGV